MKPKFRCVLHGSFGKHFGEIKHAHEVFTRAGIEVLAPVFSEITSFENGFAILSSDTETDPRMIELLYLHHLKRLGQDGFSYFVNPEGYIGKSASYELGIAQVTNVRCFFNDKISDHPAYFHNNYVISPEALVEFIKKNDSLPKPKIKRNEDKIHRLWQDLMVPGSVVAVGAIIELESRKREREVLLVKTHKWGNQYSMVGGKVKRNERLADALKREIKEETGLNSSVGRDICTFDQIKNSGYYIPGIQHIFVDKIAEVSSKKVRLNDEAQDYLWVPASVALKELPIEPNARHTLELYSRMYSRP
jgi:ADP-ribose pyrophosphatase YjhB (NUDIX family)